MEPAEHILQFFAYAHLPAHLQEVSRPFCDVATEGPGLINPARLVDLLATLSALPDNPERAVAASKISEAAQAADRMGQLRKLLEGKDAAVRALVAR